MDDYSGRIAFWKRYEESTFLGKISLLEPVATKMMKEISVPAKSYTLWNTKRNRLIQELIKGYDILIEVKNHEANIGLKNDN